MLRAAPYRCREDKIARNVLLKFDWCRSDLLQPSLIVYHMKSKKYTIIFRPYLTWRELYAFILKNMLHSKEKFVIMYKISK